MTVDVALVGYGPTGATLANLLGRRGHRVAVVEQSAEIYDKPRAITADQEVMRIFQECGLADEISPMTSPHPGTDFVGIDGQVIRRFYPAPGPRQLGWEPAWMFVQPELEAVLRQGVARQPQLQTLLRHAYQGHVQDADGVTLQLQRLDDGAPVELRARYVVACDGGRSAMRRAVGATVEDLAFDEWWIVVDAWLRRPTTLPPRCVQYCRPSRPGTYIVGPGALRRWEIKLLPGETPADFEDEAAIRRVLASFVDVDALELCRSAVYRFHALVLDRWREGRVFLAGDAAHQMPPFLGQGLCAGIRDALNLAWKLDGVLRGLYPPALLDTYEAERKPHAKAIVAHAKAFGLVIGELDEARARVRDAEMGAALAAGRSETVRQRFIPGLEDGLLARQPDGRLWPGAGQLFVQPEVQTADGTRRRLDDVTGACWRLVTTKRALLQGIDDAAWAGWRAMEGVAVMVAPPEGTPGPDVPDVPDGTVAVTACHSLLADWLAGLGAQAVVVRPDHYVYGAAVDAGELRLLLCDLAAALGRG